MNNHMQLWLISSTDEMNLNSKEDGIFIVPELEGLTGLPEIRTSSGVNAGMDGGWTSAQFFNARLISIRGVIASNDVKAVEDMRRRLNTLLAQGRQEELTLKFVTEGGYSYSIKARTTAVTMAMDTVLLKQEFLIQLRADDPVIYGYDESGGAVAILRVQNPNGGFEINFELPLLITGGADYTTIENTGSEVAYPVITLTGPLHSPTIVNQTTNQQFQISADLTALDTVIIDSQLKTVTFNGTDYYDAIVDVSDFVTLAPGSNRVYLTSVVTSDGGKAEIKFKQGYLSI